MIKKVELLAPAGDLERLKVALLYGADAVYIGGVMFGLRANAINFTLDEIEKGVEYAHKLNKKVYVTVNISLHNKEAEMLIDYLKELDRIKVDAIIVSDPYIIKVAKENTNLEVHLSTQQSTLNYESVSFFKNEGVSRIVLGRETSKEEIKEIISKNDIEIECFIHGAMCASYSGRCVLSNYFTGRDSNRGGCAQICRWDFDLLDEQKNNITKEKPFTFCTKDLSMLRKIDEMIDLGVTSFKIEGRMRSIYYIATVVSIYRKAIDNYLNGNKYVYDEKDEIILRNCANRDSIVQFFDNNYDESCQYYNGREEVSNQDFLGLVLDYNEKENIMTVEQRNYFKKGDIVEIFGYNHEPYEIEINDIFDEDNNIIDVVRHPKQVVKISINQKVQPFDMIRIKKTILTK